MNMRWTQVYMPVQEADKLLHCQSSGAVPDIQGRGDLTRGEGGGKEEGGGRKRELKEGSRTLVP